MLLSLLLLADVIAIIVCGYDCVADVIATMAGSIAIDVILWQMLFSKVADGIAYQGECDVWSDVMTISGRWNAHKVTCFTSALVLDCCTELHPICWADGTCLCSYSGMDY